MCSHSEFPSHLSTNLPFWYADSNVRSLSNNLPISHPFCGQNGCGISLFLGTEQLLDSASKHSFCYFLAIMLVTYTIAVLSPIPTNGSSRQAQVPRRPIHGLVPQCTQRWSNPLLLAYLLKEYSVCEVSSPVRLVCI